MVSTFNRYLPSRVKSNNRGNSFPLGILAPSTRNSSKKGWIIASRALKRAPGVYSSSFATMSIASGAVRGRNTWVGTNYYLEREIYRRIPTLEKGCGLI